MRLSAGAPQTPPRTHPFIQEHGQHPGGRGPLLAAQIRNRNLGTATEQCLPIPTAGDSGAAGPREPPGSGRPCAPRPGPAPQPHPSPPPPALPWLQPGLGRLSSDSAGGTRGRSCAPTSPLRRPPPSAPSVDRPGAGLGGRGGASQPQAGSAPRWGGPGSEGARWAGGCQPRGEPCSPRSPEAPGARGAQNRAAPSPGASFLSS